MIILGAVASGGNGGGNPPVQKVKVLSGSTFTVPNDCAHIDEIHMGGGGQAGFDGTGDGATGGIGGRGAWYSGSANLSLVITPSTILDIQIGVGGASNGANGTDSWFKDNNGTTIVRAPGAGSPSLAIGDTRFEGGNGDFVTMQNYPYTTDPGSIFYLVYLFPPFETLAAHDIWDKRGGKGPGGCGGGGAGGPNGMGADPGDVAGGIYFLVGGVTGCGGGAGDGGNRGGSIETMQLGTLHVGGSFLGEVIVGGQGGDGGTFLDDPNQAFQFPTPLGGGGSAHFSAVGNGGGGFGLSSITGRSGAVGPIEAGNPGGNGYRWRDSETNAPAGPGGGGGGGNGGNQIDVDNWNAYFTGIPPQPPYAEFGIGSDGGKGGTGAGGGGGGSWTTGSPYQGHGGAGGDGWGVVIYTVAP